MTFVLDGHNDLPWALRELSGGDPAAEPDVAAGDRRLHTDLPRLRAGRVGAQFWSVYVPGELGHDEAVTAVLDQVDRVRRLLAAHPDALAFADTADDVDAVVGSGRVASLMGAEGGHCIADSLAVLRVLRGLGVRYLTLTHNLNNNWADSATDTPRHDGLSPFGREVVAEMNRIGMIVDLSHVAPSTMHQALAVSTRPVLFTHSGARAVTDHPRNVPADVLEALPGNGGVVMATFVPRFVSAAVTGWDTRLREAMAAAGVDHRDLGARDRFVATWDGPPAPRATLADVVAHVEHLREAAGIDHVGIGGDFDGTSELPDELSDVSTYRGCSTRSPTAGGAPTTWPSSRTATPCGCCATPTPDRRPGGGRPGSGRAAAGARRRERRGGGGGDAQRPDRGGVERVRGGEPHDVRRHPVAVRGAQRRQGRRGGGEPEAGGAVGQHVVETAVPLGEQVELGLVQARGAGRSAHVGTGRVEPGRERVVGQGDHHPRAPGSVSRSVNRAPTSRANPASRDSNSPSESRSSQVARP